MVNQAIRIYCRLKPTPKSKRGQYEIATNESGENNLVNFHVPRDLISGFVNNKKDTYKFKFEKIFDSPTKQDEIFNDVAKDVIENCLEGYNGTIFAYGQTGSGKTFTITGGAEKYSDRGLIPRTLGYIYEHAKKNASTHEINIMISYLEIYNESGYDLLDPQHEISKMEDLPKVQLMEDKEGQFVLKNLSLHSATSEQEALNLLFLGDTNRMIAETPMNQASTRSHCMFTIHITNRESGSTTVRKSKLHLVDLAGSERVSKTGANGLLLTEAKYINLSLHYLEQVIIALSDKNRQHIPYRNSMMTSVLRDSLGGNCMTSMIATCSVEKTNVDESISTCKFAQRVALITNEVLINEVVDPSLVIARLKRDIQVLRDQLRLQSGEGQSDLSTALDEPDFKVIDEAVTEFINDPNPEASVQFGTDLRKYHHCLKLLKQRIVSHQCSTSDNEPNNKANAQQDSPTPRAIDRVRPQPQIIDPSWITDSSAHLPPETRRLKEAIQQRDSEITILVGMLKRERHRVSELSQALSNDGQHNSSQPIISGSLSDHHHPQHHNRQLEVQHSAADFLSEHQINSLQRGDSETDRDAAAYTDQMTSRLLGHLSIGRQEAMEIFKRDYHKRFPRLHEQKLELKRRVAEAKAVGEELNNCRQRTNQIKTKLDYVRQKEAIADEFSGLKMSSSRSSGGSTQRQQLEQQEEKLRGDIDKEKALFKTTYEHLKNLKQEVDHLQHLIKASDVRMIQEFDSWWQQEREKAEQNAAQGAPQKVPQLWSNSASGGQSSSRSAAMPTDAGSQKTSGRLPKTKQQQQQQRRRKEDEDEIQMTGDPEADANIRAFLRARKNLQK